MDSPAWWPIVTVLGVASITDFRWRRIPNWLVLPFLAVGLVSGLAGQGWPGLWRSLGGVAAAALPMGILFALKGLGAGDVKLAACVGAWIGPQQMLGALLGTAMAGGILAFAYAIRWRALAACLWNRSAGLAEWWRSAVDDTPGLSIPYAPAIAMGTLFSFFAC